MGTIQRNSEFEKLTTTQKGNIGEQIVQDFLEGKGFVCYRPVTEKAHPFDFLAIKDKTIAIAAEVKTKALMNKWKATGFNLSSYKDYSRFSKNHNMLIFIFFVDENMKQIYGNWLHELEKPCIVSGTAFPHVFRYNGQDVIIFPFQNMRYIADLTEETAKQLQELSTRSYGYEPEYE